MHVVHCPCVPIFTHSTSRRTVYKCNATHVANLCRSGKLCYRTCIALIRFEAYIPTYCIVCYCSCRYVQYLSTSGVVLISFEPAVLMDLFDQGARFLVWALKKWLHCCKSLARECNTLDRGGVVYVLGRGGSVWRLGTSVDKGWLLSSLLDIALGSAEVPTYELKEVTHCRSEYQWIDCG